MVGKRKIASRLPPRMYEYKGKRKNTYYTITLGNKYITLGSDLITAKKKLREIEEETPVNGTIAELIEDYLESELRALVRQGKRAPRTLADREEQKVPLIKVFGKMRPCDLTTHDAWKYLHKTRGVDAPVRANREITFLKAVFTWGLNQGVVKVNPCTGVVMNEESPRDRLVSDTELEDFVKLAREDGDVSLRHALALQIAYLTGHAQGQILRLTSKQLTNEGIAFKGRKGGAHVLVEWSDKLRAAVKESQSMPSRVTSPYIVHNQDGSPYTSGGFKKGWQLLMGKWVAGGTWEDETKREPGERFTFHDLRAKSVTKVIEQGKKASELTGHKLEATVTKIYDRRRVRKAAAVE